MCSLVSVSPSLATMGAGPLLVCALLLMLPCQLNAFEMGFRCGAPARSANKVVGGMNTEPNEYTWQAFLRDIREWITKQMMTDRCHSSHTPPVAAPSALLISGGYTATRITGSVAVFPDSPSNCSHPPLPSLIYYHSTFTTQHAGTRWLLLLLPPAVPRV